MVNFLKSGKFKIFLGRFYIFLILAIMYTPVFVLIAFSFTNSSNVGVWNGFTFELYGKLFRNRTIMNAVGNTLLLGVSTGIVATILGTLGAIGTYYSKSRVRKFVEGMTQIPVINAEIVMALSLVILIIVLIGNAFNFLTLLLGHVVLTVAFVYLAVRPRLVKMDPSIYEAALDLGATPTYALFHIIIPEIFPGIVSGFMLAFTLSLDDYIVTAFLRNNSFDTLSTYVEGVIAKANIPPELRALTTLIFIFALLFLSLNNLRASREAKAAQFRHKGGRIHD
ncbi:MAG: ABC transporter permease [Bacilli bacterium]